MRLMTNVYVHPERGGFGIEVDGPNGYSAGTFDTVDEALEILKLHKLDGEEYNVIVGNLPRDYFSAEFWATTELFKPIDNSGEV